VLADDRVLAIEKLAQFDCVDGAQLSGSSG